MSEIITEHEAPELDLKAFQQAFLEDEVNDGSYFLRKARMKEEKGKQG